MGPSTSPTSTGPSGSKLVAWPDWFPPVDLALAVIVLVIAFLATSFAARNSDLWLHLANGRLLAHGEYSPGHDPFSFTGAKRAWVDSSWIFDLLLYAAYSADHSGATLVVLKALGCVVAFGALLFLRRPGAAVWPWAFMIGIAALAAAPFVSLRPITASMVFLSATLLILFYWPWKPGTWRQPAALGGLFWLWACTDSWFLLGPATLGLVLLGDYLNRYLTFLDTSKNDWFPPTPPIQSLARTLGLGVAGCLLNPMFLAAFVQSPGEAIAQLLPTELGFGVPAGAGSDPDLTTLVQSPLDKDFWSRKIGNDREPKLNAIAFVVLIVGSAAALAGGVMRVRVQHVLLWFAFGLLALVHVRLVPFFCIISIPLTCWNLNGISSTIQLGRWADPKTQILLTASAFGRVMCIIGFLITIASAYPGWLHAPQSDPTYERVYVNRVDWVIEPDSGLILAAEQLQIWRADGTLPEDFRGLATSVEFANYCAWYAPKEKVFANSRFSFHRAELGDLLAVREVVVGKKGDKIDDKPDYEPVIKVCEKYDIAYLAIASSSRSINELAVRNLLTDSNTWMLWHIEGRFAVLGNLMLQSQDPKAFEALRYNVVRVGLGPDVKEISDGKLIPAPIYASRSFVDDYIERPTFTPKEVDDVMIWAQYGEFLNLQADRVMEREFVALQYRQFTFSAVLGIPLGVQAANRKPGQVVKGEEFLPQASIARLVLPIMMTRAARTAIAIQPDRPDGYIALAIAYRQPLAAVLDAPMPSLGMSERELQILTAQARFMERVPPIQNCPSRLARLALSESYQLAAAYEQTGQFDFAKQTIIKALALAKSLPLDVLAQFAAQEPGGKGKSPEEEAKAILKNLEQAEERITRIVQLKVERVARMTGKMRKFNEAQAQGLPARALEIYRDADAADFSAQGLQVNLMVIIMELRAGHLDQASTYIDSFTNDLKDKYEGKRVAEVQYTQEVLKQLSGIRSRLAGNYPAAAEALNATKFPAHSKAEIEASLGQSQSPAFVGLMALIGPTDIPVRVGTAVNVLQDLYSESAFQYDRGLIALNQGNMGEAKRRFELALKPQEGADLGRFAPDLAIRVRDYLVLIRRAER